MYIPLMAQPRDVSMFNLHFAREEPEACNNQLQEKRYNNSFIYVSVRLLYKISSKLLML